MTKDKVEALKTLLEEYRREIAVAEYAAPVKDPETGRGLDVLWAAWSYIDSREFIKEKQQEAQEP